MTGSSARGIRAVSTVFFSLVLFLLSPVPGSAQGEAIRIASFNIAEFGEGDHASTRNLGDIAAMLVGNGFDLIAIQEVGVAGGAESQLDKLTAQMNDLASGPVYFRAVTLQSGDERCAVIYRDPVILGDDILWLDDDKDPANPLAGGEVFYRVPPAIPFRAGSFDFYVVILHLAWGDLDRRENEVKALRAFLRDDDDPEKDWIVLGDMNRYGKYSATSAKAFNQLLTSNWKKFYRFPLLEAITDPDNMKVSLASKDEWSTTIADSRNLYDQFIITAGAYAEFETDDPVIGTHVGVIPFDRDPPYDGQDHNVVKYTVSDHRPIWARFRIDLGDDD